MRRTLALVLALFLVSLPAAPAANTGVLRTLVVRATWGPETFSEQRVRDVVFSQSNEWLREMSFGQTSLTGDVTPWLRILPGPPDCPGRGSFAVFLNQLGELIQPRLRAAGYDPSTYERLVYLFPGRCPDVGGVGANREIGLFGALNAPLVTHELGHTFSIGAHASTWECEGGACRYVEYGDPYDVMGSGDGHYNAWEKFTAGWLKNVTRASAAGSYTVDQLERASPRPQAFVVTTARNEYWFDHREPTGIDTFLAGTRLVDGLFVHAGNPEDPSTPSDYPAPNILLPNPAGRGVDALLPGDSFAERGAFELTVVAHVGTGIELRFRWTDRTRPARPRLAAVERRRRTVTVFWDPSADSGSGVERYELTLDGRPVRTVAHDFRVGRQAQLRLPDSRWHRVAVVAVDRAGNRSTATTKRVRTR